jgi:hypothetical protein
LPKAYDELLISGEWLLISVSIRTMARRADTARPRKNIERVLDKFKPGDQMFQIVSITLANADNPYSSKNLTMAT